MMISTFYIYTQLKVFTTLNTEKSCLIGLNAIIV